jgi:hypothetical protein
MACSMPAKESKKKIKHKSWTNYSLQKKGIIQRNNIPTKDIKNGHNSSSIGTPG